MNVKRLNFRTFSNLLNLLLTLGLLTAVAGFSGKVQAISNFITVTTSDDNIIDGDSLCSLREAITNANDNAATYKDCAAGLGHETINFDAALGPATITLGSALPAIGDAGVTIIGGGKITISGNDLYRVFYTNINVPLTLDGLTVTHGMGSDGGGGAYVLQGGTLTILNSTFSNNRSGLDGGGVENFGTLVINNSTFFLNSALNSGGDVITSGTLTISNSTFSSSSAPFGGALRSLGGSMTITKSTFSGNSASTYGGAIYNEAGTLLVTGSTFSGNTANVGGGINNVAMMSLANSTFFGNSASIGGGVYNGYETTVIIYTSTIANSTFSANTATSAGGGVSNDSILDLSNTIIANSTGGGDCDSQGTANGAHNLIEDNANACGLINGVNGNIIGSDPSLGPGTGSPVYIPLNGGSLAIDAGDDATCAAVPVNNTSQNGISRPQGAHCDIGAYEADVTPPFVVSILRADPNPTTSATLHFTVTFSEPVYGISVNDFALTTANITGATVSGISSSLGTAITVTVSTGIGGPGAIRLDLIDRDTILDAANLHLGGDGLHNGNFTSGEVYYVRFLHTYFALVQR